MRTVFVGFCAYVGRIVNRTMCEVWTADPAERDFATEQLLAVDLNKNPSAAMKGAIDWADVEVDDHITTGGLTGIGPLWPEGASTGLVYLADRFLERLPVRPEPLEFDGEPYEQELVIYHPGAEDPRAGRRYRGFHAVVVERRGTSALVEVYPAMGSKSSPPFEARWLDLQSVAVCDAGVGSMTAIDRAGQGALFLESKLISEWGRRPPDDPPPVERKPSRKREAGLAAAAALSASFDPKTPAGRG